MILDYLNEIDSALYSAGKKGVSSDLHPHSPFNPSLHEGTTWKGSELVNRFKPDIISVKPTKRPVFSSVDWLRCTTKKLHNLEGFTRKFLPMLKGHGFSFHDTGKGLNGYTHAFVIQFNGENCGHICADDKDKMGGSFELSGLACQLLQGRWDLWCLLISGLNENEFRIKRLDVCTDFKGKLWDVYSLNIVDINKLISDGLHSPARGVSPDVCLIGDWSGVVAKCLDGGGYDPKRDAQKGLTINVGNSDSVNKNVWYEKGKQLAGKNPERYDGSLGSWVRYERRFGTGSGRSQVVIPFDFAVLPDEALIYNSPKVAALIDDWISFQKGNDVDIDPVEISGIDLERVGLLKGICFKRTARHVASQSARFFRSLTMLGINPHDFVDAVISDESNKGFDPAFNSNFSLGQLFGSPDDGFGVAG